MTKKQKKHILDLVEAMLNRIPVRTRQHPELKYTRIIQCIDLDGDCVIYSENGPEPKEIIEYGVHPKHVKIVK